MNIDFSEIKNIRYFISKKLDNLSKFISSDSGLFKILHWRRFYVLCSILLHSDFVQNNLYLYENIFRIKLRKKNARLKG